ncbi:MAG: ribbon-helix-helix protein, CopG family [Chromatiales bacterium]|nr:ribbon-helix-helix protein, CopG family [Chromatiales bacterium]
MTTLTMRIDDQMAADLQAIADAQHRTKSDVAREMLRKDIALEKFRQLRRTAMPLAEAAGYLTDDDVFDAIS